MQRLKQRLQEALKRLKETGSAKVADPFKYIRRHNHDPLIEFYNEKKILPLDFAQYASKIVPKECIYPDSQDPKVLPYYG